MSQSALRVGLVGPLPPPSGGMANQTLQLARLLETEGVQVSVVQVNAPYKPAWVARLRGLRAGFRLFPYLAALWRVAGQADVLHVMANSGWSWHLFAAPAIWIGRLRGIPVVINYRGGEAESFLARQHAAVAVSMRRAAALIVPSGFLKQVFEGFGLSSQVVPNVVNLERFTVRPVPPPQRPLQVLVARNLEPIYDNASALRAFALVRAELPDARLTIAGSGPLRAELEALAAELGVAEAVHFSGRVDHAGMNALYHSADVMLNPSLVDNTPNSVLEALACGVAVVSTWVGGVPFLVKDGETALLVPPADPRAMANAVLRLERERALAATLRGNGLALVQQFTWASVWPRLLQLYQSVQRPRANEGIDFS
jgi:glycosyltransferase involved in cell wall biosynthesis